jgi:hypothetical protein
MIHARALFVLTGLALFSVACASHQVPPGPGEARGALPDLRGFKVMVLPVQLQAYVPQGVQPDPELAHALRSRGPGVSWILPPDLDDALSQSPSVPARIRDLPVQIFLQAQVNRVGDPIFGHIVRLRGLTGADVALIPVELRYGEAGSYQLAAAVVDTRSGRVYWYGVVQGAPGEAEDISALASVSEALARVILPLG